MFYLKRLFSIFKLVINRIVNKYYYNNNNKLCIEKIIRVGKRVFGVEIYMNMSTQFQLTAHCQ